MYEIKLTLDERIDLKFSKLDKLMIKIPNVLKEQVLKIYVLGIEAGILIERNKKGGKYG